MIKRINNKLKYESNRLLSYLNFRILELRFCKTGKTYGYNVFGYFNKKLGQAEVARNYLLQLIDEEVLYNMVSIDAESHFDINQNELTLQKKKNINEVFHNNIFFIDVVHLKMLLNKYPLLFKNKHNIFVFWWEFDTGFEDRLNVLSKMDEIFVFSEFIKTALLKSGVDLPPIVKKDYVLYKNWEILDTSDCILAKYGLSNQFYFFFNFDFLSGYKRKNPKMIIEVFKLAFENNDNVKLIIKINNHQSYKVYVDELYNVISALGLVNKVIIIADLLTRSEFMTLLNNIDAYVSLHRGEGLGLGMLEALTLGKPVIATNYGGNTEFMSNELAFPVNYKLVESDDEYLPYINVKQWAEPDIDDAVDKMRLVYQRFKKSKM